MPIDAPSDPGSFPSVADLGEEAGAAATRHLDRTFRRLLGGPGVDTTPRFVRLLTGAPHPFGNIAVLADPGDLDGLPEAVDPLVAENAPAAVLFTGRPAPPVVTALEAAGFVDGGAMPAMIAPIDALAATGLPDDARFERVLDLEVSDAWTRALAVGYELPIEVAAAFSPDRVGLDPAPDAPVQFFAVRIGDRTVATSMLVLEGGVAGIYCVATIPEARRRGLGAHATAEALRGIRTIGCRTAVLQSSPDGHAVYRRLGFTDVAAVPLFVRMPS